MKPQPKALAVAPLKRAFPGVLLLWALTCGVVHADQTVSTGNAGTLTSNVQLRFDIVVAKYVQLRVGNADASLPTVSFNVALSPVFGAGNNQAYNAGAVPPTFATSVATTNPASAAGTLVVAAVTNVTGTLLTCTLSPLGIFTAFAVGATAAGIPGTSDITVTSTAGATNLQHPSASLTGCTSGSTAAIPSLTPLGGSFTYGTSFSANALKAGSYGNTVTYTATTL